jgi:pimeloyl-ACP methyl ester carboxylesterase
MVFLPEFRLDFILDLKLNWNGFFKRTVSLSSASACTTISYFQIQGKKRSKTPLLFVHGLGATSSHFADAMIFMAKKGFPVFAPDLPGHGMSSDPPEGLNAETLFRDFSNWIEKVMPPQPFALIGNSLGGGICLKYAAEFPDRVARLVLLSPAAAFSTEGQWVDFRKTMRFSTIQESREYLARVFPKPPIYIHLLGYSTWRAFNRVGVKNLLKTAQAKDFKLRSGFRERLPPTLVIWGKDEKVFPHSHLDWIRRELPERTIVEEPEGVGHCPQLDASEWFNERLLRFVETQK